MSPPGGLHGLDCHALLNFWFRAARAARGEEGDKKNPRKAHTEEFTLTLVLSVLACILAVLYLYALCTRDQERSRHSAVSSGSFNYSDILPATADPSFVFRDPTKQHTLRPQGPHLFVQYSAYRLSASSFVALGLLARDLVTLATHQYQKCFWEPFGWDSEGREVRGEAVPGNVRLIQNYEHHDKAYRLLFVFCNLEREVPSTASGDPGGRLFLSIEESVEALYTKGYQLKSLIYREDPGFKPFAAYEEDPGPFIHNISHCSAPMYGHISADRVAQWLHYHFMLGVDHFLLFDAGAVDDTMRNTLKPFTDSGLVELQDFRKIKDFPMYLDGQLLAVNDCIYRFRHTTKWLLYADFDEFLWVDKPHTSLHDLLSKHEDKPYISHGVLWYDTKQCLPSNGYQDLRWPTERMLWHWPAFWCMHKEKFPDAAMCLNYWGHRKLIVNPRKVRHLENHVSIDPEGTGVDLPANELRHNHFQGLMWPGNEGECNTTRSQDANVEWWARTSEQAAATEMARTTSINFPLVRASHKNWVAHVNKVRGRAAA